RRSRRSKQNRRLRSVDRANEMSETATEATPTEQTAERPEITRIREKLPDAIQEIVEFRGDTRITVRRERVIDVLKLMRDDLELQYNFFAECLGVDYLDPKTR